MESSFLKSAARFEGCPRLNLPRIAFAGRSNVGKSSLINSLVGRRRLALTSSSPGRTRLINFFLVNSKWIFVDLPGYGYAKASKTEKARWGPMIEDYLKKDALLKRLLLLVDCRRDPSPLDDVMKDWLHDYDIPFQVVAMKADKLSKSRLQQSIRKLEAAFETDHIIPFSVRSGVGRKELWRTIQED